MKKTILILAFTGLTAAAIAQRKPQTARYNYLATMPYEYYQQLLNIAHDYKDQQIFNPALNDQQKISMQQGMYKYLFNLPKAVKIDSIAIAADTSTTIPPRKK